ncbi:unnamed protein product [Prunus brigantina]
MGQTQSSKPVVPPFEVFGQTVLRKRGMGAGVEYEMYGRETNTQFQQFLSPQKPMVPKSFNPKTQTYTSPRPPVPFPIDPNLSLTFFLFQSSTSTLLSLTLTPPKP